LNEKKDIEFAKKVLEIIKPSPLIEESKNLEA